jgi:hypothetical protein
VDPGDEDVHLDITNSRADDEAVSIKTEVIVTY